MSTLCILDAVGEQQMLCCRPCYVRKTVRKLRRMYERAHCVLCSVIQAPRPLIFHVLVGPSTALLQVRVVLPFLSLSLSQVHSSSTTQAVRRNIKLLTVGWARNLTFLVQFSLFPKSLVASKTTKKLTVGVRYEITTSHCPMFHTQQAFTWFTT